MHDYCYYGHKGQGSFFIFYFSLLPVLVEEVILSVPCVCLSVWVYSGHIIHHYNGIWGSCAPGRRNMHHWGAICTTVHKGDYVFWKIQGTLMIFCFGGSLKTYMYLNGSHGWFIGSQVFEWVTLLQLFIGFMITSIFHTYEKLVVHKLLSYDCE